MRTLLPLLFLAGCLSADGASDRWADWVEQHNSCEAPEDCVVVLPDSCALGCGSAVNAEYQEEALDELESLEQRTAGLEPCKNACEAVAGTDCVAEVCEVLWEE